ncbi:MAG: hypothetical protein EWV40_18950 [Microcystis flos-aquae Mf_WU_F_19750830_S460]|uniref:Uncharacterized protein n=1 Tax=Microcystis flos-aquae Mf_WU_F_19750830_S460 TaxID=2486237 RepID=A0A552LAQ9_9CHRO|nr:MAG: hypothetical protein EWV40_18950 [Microcystis flos-aquae Mf_WU_F_19750830_S460]
MPFCLSRVCGKKFFLGAGCGVWGVGFYPFSGRSARLRRELSRTLSRVDGEPVEPPGSIA